MLNSQRNAALISELCAGDGDRRARARRDAPGLVELEALYCPLLRVLVTAHSTQGHKDALNRFVAALVSSHLTPASARYMLGLFRPETPVQRQICGAAIPVAPGAAAAPARFGRGPAVSALNCEGKRATNGEPANFLQGLGESLARGGAHLPTAEADDLLEIAQPRGRGNAPPAVPDAWRPLVPAAQALMTPLAARVTDLFVMWLPTWRLSGATGKVGSPNVQRSPNGAPHNFSDDESWAVASFFWTHGWTGRLGLPGLEERRAVRQAHVSREVTGIQRMLRFSQFRSSDLTLATAALEITRAVRAAVEGHARLPENLSRMGLVLPGARRTATRAALSPGLDVLVVAGALRALGEPTDEVYRLAGDINALLSAEDGRWEDAAATTLAGELTTLLDRVRRSLPHLGTFDAPKAPWADGIEQEAVALVHQCGQPGAEMPSIEDVQERFTATRGRLKALQALSCNLILLFVQAQHESLARWESERKGAKKQDKAIAACTPTAGEAPIIALQPVPPATWASWEADGAAALAQTLNLEATSTAVLDLAAAMVRERARLVQHVSAPGGSRLVLRIGSTSKAMWVCASAAGAAEAHVAPVAAKAAGAAARKGRAKANPAMEAAMRCFYYKHMDDPRSRVPLSEKRCEGPEGAAAEGDFERHRQATRFVRAVLYGTDEAEFRGKVSCVVEPIAPGDATKRCRMVDHVLPHDEQAGAMDAGCSSNLRLGAQAPGRQGTWGSFVDCTSGLQYKLAHSAPARRQNTTCNRGCTKNPLPNQECRVDEQTGECAVAHVARPTHPGFLAALEAETAPQRNPSERLAFLQRLEVGNPFVLFLQPEGNCVPYYRYPHPGQDFYVLTAGDGLGGMSLAQALGQVVLTWHAGALLGDVGVAPEITRIGVVSAHPPDRPASTCAELPAVASTRAWFPWVEATALKPLEGTQQETEDMQRVEVRLTELGLSLRQAAPACFGRKDGAACLRPFTLRAGRPAPGAGAAPAGAPQEAVAALSELATLASTDGARSSDDSLLQALTVFAHRGSPDVAYWASSYAASLAAGAGERPISRPVPRPRAMGAGAAADVASLAMDVVVYAEERKARDKLVAVTRKLFPRAPAG